MINWHIDKNNKIPLYLQLKDLIKYHISTGNIRDRHHLPGVHVMGQTLGINFETVRKAYKELEKEGLISMRRGCGSYVSLHADRIPESGALKHRDEDPLAILKIGIRKLILEGADQQEIRGTVEDVIRETAQDLRRQTVIFTECNLHQVKEISNQLSAYLHLPVLPVLLSDLKTSVERFLSEEKALLGVITTGFHINEVRKSLSHTPVKVHVLITRMSPVARRRLEKIDKRLPLGFICRDRESLFLYRELIKEDLGKNIKLSCSIMGDKDLVKEMLRCVKVLLVSPPVYHDVKKIAPREIPVFNVFDCVEPMSLKLIKDRIHRQL